MSINDGVDRLGTSKAVIGLCCGFDTSVPDVNVTVSGAGGEDEGVGGVVVDLLDTASVVVVNAEEGFLLNVEKSNSVISRCGCELEIILAPRKVEYGIFMTLDSIPVLPKPRVDIF